MKEKIGKLLVCVLFCALISYIGAVTLKSSKDELQMITDQSKFGSEAYNLSTVERILNDHLHRKDLLVTFNGLIQRLMCRRLVGNEQFYRDCDEVMHMSLGYIPCDLLVKDIEYLANECEKRSIPFLVCQTAERAAYGDQYSRFIDGRTLEYMEPLKEAVQSEGVLYLDYATSLAERGFLSKDIFFKTDVHFKTQTEFYMLQRIIQYLEEKTQLRFANQDTALSLDQYSIETYPFWGNLVSYSVGDFYIGHDEFEYYLPKFETSMHLENPVGTEVRYGGFEDICMNNYRSIYGSRDKAYRVTDYMQWPSPYYRVTNDLVQNHDILVIGCSMSMRTMAYLSLMCKSVTVLDPRYFGEMDVLNEALKDDYDAVILFASRNLLDFGLRGSNALR